MRYEDILVVDSTEGAAELLALLQAAPGPFGVDCETVDCDPKKQSPVGTARIVCFTVAWKEGPTTRAAFVWAEYLEAFRPWLEGPAPKIGANFPGYDMHCFENHGIRIGGFIHDNKHTSRLWYSSKDVRHDLKSQAEEVLGYKTRAFMQLFSRRCENKPKTYAADKFYAKGLSKKGPLAGVPTLVIGGSWPTFSATERELIPLDRIRTEWPHRVRDLITYAAEDAVWSLELAPKREAQLASRPAKTGSTLQLYQGVWNPMLLMLNRMERSGFEIDAACAERVRSEAQADMDALMPGICEFAGATEFNPGSPQQLQGLLRDQLKLQRPPIKGTLFAISRAEDDEWSTAEASLHWLQLKHPEHNEGLDLIRRWRKARRQMQTGRDLPGFRSPLDGRVHCVLGPDTDTGRLSCKLPALQQVSSKNDTYGIRGAFVAAPGMSLVVADFSQLEVYVLAHMLIRLFGDTSLYDALRSGDVYTWIARAAWPHDPASWTDADYKAKGHPANKRRNMAKILVLATNYGKTPMGLALTLLDETGEPAAEQYCADLLQTYMGVLPGVAMWQEWIAAYARKHRGVPTLLGRWRPLAAAGTKRGDRQALNSPIQGGAMDIAALVMLALNTYDLRQQLIDHALPWFNAELAALGARCLLQVHDELIFEVPEANAEAAMALITHGMTHPPMLDLAVQLQVEADIGHSWKDAK
jgi:DNA polymerase I-like protein with 3'-5' exonuclease and polymerase domains